MAAIGWINYTVSKVLHREIQVQEVQAYSLNKLLLNKGLDIMVYTVKYERTSKLTADSVVHYSLLNTMCQYFC